MRRIRQVVRRHDLHAALVEGIQHVGVQFADLVAAVARREMYCVNDHLGNPEVWMVRVPEVEYWAEGRARLGG